MQLIFTPNDISTAGYQPNDYAYAGALLATHSLYSRNPVTKTGFHTELMAGVRGPASLAAQTQKLVHRIIDYQEPMGWDHQLPGKFLFNGLLTAEKQIAAAGKWLEIIGSGQVFADNIATGATVYQTVRIGKMVPYFTGFLEQYRGHSTAGLQAYFVIRPKIIFELNNAMQEGKASNWQSESKDSYESTETAAAAPVSRTVNRVVYSFDFGAVLAYGKCALSFNQNTPTALVSGLYNHEVGNISLYIGL